MLFLWLIKTVPRLVFVKNGMSSHFLSVIQKREEGIALLDNASTAQLPDCVINAISDFYYNSNYPATGASYRKVEDSTSILAEARFKTLRFFNASNGYSVVFCKNATEAFLMVVKNLLYHWTWDHRGILITNLEHNSVYKPIGKLSKDLGVKLDILDLLTRDSALEVDGKYKFAALTMASNVIGRVWKEDFSDLAQMVKNLKNDGAIVALDACQASAHEVIDLDKIGADILFFSGHKIGGPHGIGGLVVKEPILFKMMQNASPEPSSGLTRMSMVQEFKSLELGSHNLAQAVGLGEVLDFYATHVDFKAYQISIQDLSDSIVKFLQGYRWVKVLGQEFLMGNRYIISFVPGQIPLHDFSWVLAENGALVRSGKMCADLACDSLGVDGCIRISLFFYNNQQDCQAFFKAFEKTANFFQGQL